MARIPQKYAPFVFGVIQAAITTAVATAIATHQLTEFGLLFLEQWAFAWLVAWLTMLPVVILLAPLLQRMVIALTVSHGTESQPDQVNSSRSEYYCQISPDDPLDELGFGAAFFGVALTTCSRACLAARSAASLALRSLPS